MALSEALGRLRDTLKAWFPERHIYIRTDGQMKGLYLSTPRQVTLAAAVGLLGLWTTASLLATVMAMAAAPAGQAAQDLMRARVARLAAQQAKLEDVVSTVTCDGAPTAARPTTPAPGAASLPGPPAASLKATKARQDRLVTRLDALASPCVEHLSAALTDAGLDPTRFDAGSAAAPAVVAKTDPERDAHAAFLAHLRALGQKLAEMRRLRAAAAAAPLLHPTKTSLQSSGFGVRLDPFTNRPALHPGLDFPAPWGTPVFATAGGVVAFAGRSETYGNLIEIDHGHGLRTRFAHLAAFWVRPGQHVEARQPLGAVGSTGRSTGPHLHYEVWMDGQAKDPEGFLRAGDHVHQTGAGPQHAA
jgi:murein DD-endopeptidase MepM/ murein hydrolase activator NlpD